MADHSGQLQGGFNFRLNDTLPPYPRVRWVVTNSKTLSAVEIDVEVRTPVAGGDTRILYP
jgi:hypothetical protein